MRTLFCGFLLAMVLLPVSCGRCSLQSSVQAQIEQTAKMEQANMREIFIYLLLYRNTHQQAFPKESGQKFILELWRSKVMPNTENNARLYFSAAEPYAEYLNTIGQDPAEQTIAAYLSQWNEIYPGWINYAAFDPHGDASLREKLQNDPASVTVLANATFAYRNRIYYMTGDGAIGVLNVEQLIKDGLLTQEEFELGIVPVGPRSKIKQLQTVSND
jgi:hypothetical protein